jgi:ankyrin repeat protein
MSNINKSIESSTDTEQKTSIKKLLKDRNLNPNKSEDLKYLLSLSLLPKINKYKFNFKSLLSYLLKYKNPKNDSVFNDFLFQSCELGKIDNVRILLKYGLDLNKQNELGETALHIAVAKNDIELVKLIAEQEPRTDLLTFKDDYSVINYAEIYGNENVIEIIQELNERNKKKIIKSEIVDFINKDMVSINAKNLSNISSFVNINNKDFDEIQNYNGEKLSIIANDDLSNNLISINLNVNKEILHNDKNFSNINTIINDSELYDDISPKNINKINNYNYFNCIKNNNKNILLDNRQSIPISKSLNPNELKYYTSPTKKKENNYSSTGSIKSSYLQSLKTCHTSLKGQYESPVFQNKVKKILDKRMELYNFIKEINLPIKYAEILLDNGFDDLEVLINQTKSGVALSYQNLKEIGVGTPGERGKILIHLEEITDIFNFDIEKDIIYSDKMPDEKTGSLYLFLERISLEEYFQIFVDNGYNSAELLFMQMISKNPITEDILKRDLGINKIGHLQRIMISLNEESKKYINNLENKSKKKSKMYNHVLYEEKSFLKHCEACLIF